MKVGLYLWLAVLAIFVALVVFGVATNVNGARNFFTQQLDSFLKRPRISQIIIGFVVWLIFVIVPLHVFFKLFYCGEGPGFEVLSAFLILWPLAWPITLLLLLVLGTKKVFKRSEF